MRMLIVVSVVLLLLLSGQTAQASGDPITCQGYPEPRIYLENQSWWSPQPGPPTHPGTGQTGHIHVGMCFPLYQEITGSTLHLDVTVKLHNMPGRPSWLRATSYGDTTWEKRAPGDHDPAKYIPSCPISDCEVLVPWDIDLSSVRYNGWHEFAVYLNVEQTNGEVQRNWPRWYVNFQLPGLPEGVPKCLPGTLPYCPDGQFGTYASRYSDWVGGDTWYSNTAGGSSYARALIFRSSMPWNESTGELTPVSGVWSPMVGFGAPVAFVLVDPSFHATPPSEGMVVFQSPPSAPPPGGLQQVAIDTTQLTNGLHRLVIGTSRVLPNGTNTGVLVVPFLVQNGC